MKQRWIRTLLGLFLTAMMLIPVVQDSRPALLERFEHDLYDIRLRQFLADDIDPRVVIIDVDEASLAEEGRWPWNRNKLALMLDRLFDEYGVAIVGFDMVFSESDQSVDLRDLQNLAARGGQGESLSELLGQLNSDQRFSEAISDRPVVLGYLFDRSERQLQVGQPGAAVIDASDAAHSALAELPIPQASGIISSVGDLQNSSRWNGFFDNPLVDSDGVYRRVPMLQRYQDHYYPSLALAVLLALFDDPTVVPVIETDMTGEKQALNAIEAAGIHIPVDQYGAVLVPYRGPQGSFPYISATDVIQGTADLAQLEGAIALVGTSAAGLLDLRVTPVSNRYSGVEVHANLIAGMLDERIQHQPDYTVGVEITQLLISGILLSLLIPRASVMLSTMITLIWLGMLISLNLYAWYELQWVIPLGYTLMLVIVLFLFQQTTGYFFETRNIAQLANQFGQYIPPEVVEELSHQDQSVQLTGENRDMSVFFSDVRDFTSLSEQLSPQQLTRLMNIYLTGVTEVIHHQRGTVDKYIGDAVMAFWGAPLKDEKHPEHALHAAMQMLELLPTLNQRLAREGLPEVRVGMGINCGPMNVGNMGSEFRMAYTVMGDAVNLASRLEGLTKYYGCPLLVSGELAGRVPEYLYRKLDTVTVKGRQEPVDLMQPVCLREQASEADVTRVELFTQCLEDYRSQQWQAAAEGFERYLVMVPEDTAAKLYIKRIAGFRHHPPAADWQGVFNHTSK